MYSDTMNVTLIEMDSLKRIEGETRILGKASVSDKLGVGTKYPEAELDVRGNMALSGEARINGELRIPQLANANKDFLYADGVGKINRYGLDDLRADLYTANPGKTCQTITIANSNLDWSSTHNKMWLNPVGPCNKLGIGTDNPQEAVDIVGNTNISGRLKIGSNSIIIESLGSGSGILNNIYADNNGNMHLQPFDKSTGKIGVGLNSNTAPQAKLDVVTSDPNWTAQFINLAGNGKGVNIAAGSGSAAGPVLQVRSDDGSGLTNYLLQVNTVQATAGLPARGYVGIGTPNPTCSFQVKTSDRANWTACFENGWGDGKGVLIKSGSGSAAGPALLVKDNSANGGVAMFQVDASTHRTDVWGSLYVNGVQVGSSASPATSWQNNGTTTYYNGGSVGIGESNVPSGYKLVVNGKVGAREFKVTQASPWPDFVFEKEYTLLSLEETEKFIQKNKHLPGVPSAKQIEENGGVDIGEMNRILLQKIEELTLQLINQQKQINELKK